MCKVVVISKFCFSFVYNSFFLWSAYISICSKSFIFLKANPGQHSLSFFSCVVFKYDICICFHNVTLHSDLWWDLSKILIYNLTVDLKYLDQFEPRIKILSLFFSWRTYMWSQRCFQWTMVYWHLPSNPKEMKLPNFICLRS